MNRQIKVRIFLKEMYEFPDFTEMDTKDFIEMEKLLNRGGKMMEWTGFKDKNGVDVYEGDICTWLTEGDKFSIIFNSSTGCFDMERPDTMEVEELYPMFLGGENPKVIGNIYENSKLLKSK